MFLPFCLSIKKNKKNDVQVFPPYEAHLNDWSLSYEPSCFSIYGKCVTVVSTILHAKDKIVHYPHMNSKCIVTRIG